jgi:hypothetical protein
MSASLIWLASPCAPARHHDGPRRDLALHFFRWLQIRCQQNPSEIHRKFSVGRSARRRFAYESDNERKMLDKK